MEWTDILTALIGALAGGGLTAIFTLKAARKKADGEADSAALAPLKEANEIIREQLKEANEREAELEERRRVLTAEKDALYEQIISLREEGAVVKQYICVHGGCQLRKPGKGLGPKYFESHREDFELTIDNLPVNVLLREYGARKQAIAEKAVADDTDTKNNDNDE